MPPTTPTQQPALGGLFLSYFCLVIIHKCSKPASSRTASVVGFNGLLPAFTEMFRQNMLAAASQVDLTVTGTTDGVFDASIVESVHSVEGVARATGSLRQSVILPAGSAVDSVAVAGIDPATAPGVRPYTLVTGRYLHAGDANTMVISESLSKPAKLGIGDTLTLPSSIGSTGFEIVGIISARTLFSTGEVYV
ncbi:MAG: ABC transporter permease, partial [Anaerolineae bacterium]